MVCLFLRLENNKSRLASFFFVLKILKNKIKLVIRNNYSFSLLTESLCYVLSLIILMTLFGA